ncbi:MAG: MalY/PatB family protein [Acidimicrobiales bacterium]
MPRPLHSFDNFTPDSLRRRGSIKWQRYGNDVLAAWVAEMDFAAPPAVRAAILAAVEREEFGYPVRDTDCDLPGAVADWEAARYGWEVDPARVHILPDVLKGVELAVDRFSPPDSPVILTTPAYMPFFDIPTVVRRPAIEVPTVVDGKARCLDYAGIDEAFARGAGTIILCHPYNPIGRSFTHAEMAELSRIVEHHHGRVVSDEVHAPLTYPGGRHVPYASISGAAAGHALTLVSASKAWNLPGLKCAQVITTNDADEERWQSIPALKTHGASTVGIRSNIAAFREGAPWLDDALAYLDGNRRVLGELLREHLPDVGYTAPEATYLAWLDCRRLGLDVEPADFFLEHARVATSPGAAFGADGAGHVRFNFATSRAILEQAVEAMGAAVSRRRRPD